MAEKVQNCVTENTFVVKEEFEDDVCLDDKMCISKTTITEARDGRIKQYEISTVDDIKIKSSDISNRINDNVKREDEIFSANNIKIEYDSELLFCKNCQEIFRDYCTKCKMLVHVLNPNPQENTYKEESDETPKHILEMKELFGRLGIFTLKVIPQDVKFGPFIGLDTSEYCRRLKGGRFVLGKDKSKCLNWMQYVNPARNISEQNLLAFQCDNDLYYSSIREIQVDEELLVYFGREYDESLNKDVEVDFIPTVEDDIKDVFGCTFCCLGFSLRTYLSEHKAICRNKFNEKFSVEEVVQCPFCKIYLDKKEYFEYHMSRCRERSERKCSPPKPDNQTIEIYRGKPKGRHMYKCAHCKYQTAYKVDLQTHAGKHCEVKTYKCAVCSRRFKKKGYLKMHVEKIHVDVDWNEAQKWFRSELMKTPIKTRRSKVHRELQDGAKLFGCTECGFRTKSKPYLKSHVKIKHLKEFKFRCEMCDYKTNKSHLERHVNTVHLKEFNYKCEICQCKRSRKLTLEKHIKTMHLKEFDYKCGMCEYKCSKKWRLEDHIKAKHLKEFDYKCELCEYKTNDKSYIETHIKTKHLKEFKYKCELCEVKTNLKSYLKKHIKSKHLKEFKYKCEMCQFLTNCKSHLESHIRIKHLKTLNYKCELCEYKANQKANLEIHIKSKHLKEFKYKCELCDYKTNQKTHLERHTNAKHLKEFDYTCETCGYNTSDKSNLKMHVKTVHLKEFKYRCEICQYKTNRRTHLEAHRERIHHKGRHQPHLETN